MQRTVIFAHYDKNNIIQDYVVYYLSELKKCAENIIFVSDSDISEEEMNKISGVVDYSITGKHGEYDFGSYKRGFNLARENGILQAAEELIFANDSCFAPLFPFENMFAEMSVKPLDFWGATFNDTGITVENDSPKVIKFNHLQSYFVVFKPSVFNSEIFINFINSVKKEKSKIDVIINYEMGMTRLLEENGFKYDSYSQISKEISGAPIGAYKNLIKKEHFPFLKREIVLYRLAESNYPVFLRHLILKYTNYSYKMIQSDRKQNAKKLAFYEHILFACKAGRKSSTNTLAP